MGRRSLRSNAMVLVFATLGACNAFTNANEYAVASGDGGGATPSETSKPNDGSLPPEDEQQPDDVAKPPPPKPTSVVVTAPDGLDFGASPCGSQASSRQVEIKNTGAGQITFQAEISGDLDSFAVAPTSGTLASGETTMLSVTPAAIPATSAVGEQLATLTLTTSAPDDAPHALPMKIVVSGAIFTVSPSGTLDWGTLQNQPVKKNVVVRNDGNLAGTIAFSLFTATFGAYSIDPKSADLAPGEVKVLEITASPPKSGPTVKSGHVSFSSSSTRCGPVPGIIQLTCRRPD